MSSSLSRFASASGLSTKSVSEEPITRLLHEFCDGADPGGDRLAAAVLDRLRAIAYYEMSARSSEAIDALTIEPGVLANDALMKVLGKKPSFANRRHFFSYATQIMVNALIDYQRERRTQKRGGGMVQVTLSGLGLSEESVLDVETLPPILEQLRELDPRKAEIVQLRVFWGMNLEEVAKALEVSVSTVERDWRFARRWLSSQLRRSGSATTIASESGA